MNENMEFLEDCRRSLEWPAVDPPLVIMRKRLQALVERQRKEKRDA